jgi:transcriptional regulator with GAF, ATPase, and Fis domain
MDEMNSSEANMPRLVDKKLRELRALAQMNKEIHSVMNMNKLLRILVERAVTGVNFERFLLYLLEDDYLRCVAWIDRVKREKASIIEKRVGFDMDEHAVEVLVVKMGKPIYVENALFDKRVSQKLLRISDTKEYCVVPLIGRNKILGVITGDKRYSQEKILSEDMETFQLFAGHISLALENAMLYEEKDRFNRLLKKTVEERTFELEEANHELSMKMKELATLYQMSKLLNKSLDQASVLDQMSLMVKRLGYHMFQFCLLRDNELVPVLLEGLDRGAHQEADFIFSEKILDEITRNEYAPVINDMTLHHIKAPFRAFFRERGIQSCILVPILARGILIGILTILSKDPDIFHDEQRKFFSAFGQQAGMALENAMRFQKVVEEKNHIKILSKRIERENVYLKEKIKSDFVIGKSPEMREVMDLVRKVAPGSTTVIVYGETGTGKEFIANAIHEMSPRKDAPLIKVNCAAIPDDLLESELFGHEKGAFTGAFKKRVGMFELAQNGTIFLDEIGDLSQRTQTKILRVLQEQEIQPLGSKSVLRVDVRVIAATNKKLEKRIDENLFRSDLFYRLNVFPIHLPPLRERKDDVPELVKFFLSKYAHLRMGRMAMDQAVYDAFGAYNWPGNIRELENVIERLMIISKGNLITKADLPREFSLKSGLNAQVKPLREALFNFKKDMIEQALAEASGKKAKAAELLGLPRSNFSRLLKNLDLI